MIVLFLKDGLGNQLFEYAFARRLSQIYGDRVVINRIYFKRKKDRSCQLERLALAKDVTYSGGIASFLFLLLLEFRIFLSLGPKFYLIHRDQEAFNRVFGGAEEISAAASAMACISVLRHTSISTASPSPEGG